MISNPLNSVSTYYQHPEKLIENVVDAIRSTGNITNIVDKGNGYYTFTVDNISSFYGGEYITITNTDGFNSETQNVTNITSTGFDIEKTSGTVIPANLGEYKCNAPYYSFSGHLKFANELLEKDLSKYFKNQKFPCVLCLLDITKNYLDDMVFLYETNIKLLFGNQTKQDYTNNERLENVFLPVLDAMFNDFVSELTESTYVYRGNERIPIEVIDRYFFGTQQNNQNKWNARVDLKECNFNNLKFYNKVNQC